MFDVIAVWKFEVFFWRYIVEHGGVKLIDHCCVDRVGDVIVIWCDIGCEWSECVEGSFVILFELFLYVFFDQVYGHVIWFFVHYLYIVFLGDFVELVLGFEFGELCFVVRVCD